jgi:hypothetical protein
MNKLKFDTTDEIVKWANTTLLRTAQDSIVFVQHYQDKLYYYFKMENHKLENYKFTLQMTSENNIFDGK